LQVVEDEGMEGKLEGRVIVITGTSSGLGIETARALSITGATLFLTARNVRKAKDALADISEPGRTEFIEMDLESFESVRAAAKAILQKTDKVNILINNAGIMAVPGLEFTKNGHELQFGTNHLSHFLFFQLLKPALLAATTPNSHSRVVNVSSAAHRLNGINATDNYNFEKGGTTPGYPTRNRKPPTYTWPMRLSAAMDLKGFMQRVFTLVELQLVFRSTSPKQILRQC
jgi:NAD(P)-dependent dehydrogenase (short-subunit alcohol dehydrogenase family)